MSSFNSSSSNMTLYHHPYLCTVQTCPLTLASIHYLPSLAGNVFYLAVFSLVLIAQTSLGFYYRTWPFLAALVGGEVLEIIGYVARIQMHYNPFHANPFLMYLVCLTIAPCFISAGIYLCLSRIIVVYGEHLARFKPRTYTIIFISCDIFSLVLQAVGGALADTANSKSLSQTGINIMIAGLSCQVVSLAIFIGLCLDFARRVVNMGVTSSHRTLLRLLPCSLAHFYAFLIALGLATLTVFVRSCFRVAELHGGFGGTLANQEVTFMILEGAMIVIASIALTFMHPGTIFKETWKLDRARAALRGDHQVIDEGKDDILLSKRGL